MGITVSMPLGGMIGVIWGYVEICRAFGFYPFKGFADA